MKRLVALAAAIVVASSWTAGRAGDNDKVGESAYYPLKVGTTWTYNGPMNTSLVNKVVAHEKIGDVMCAKIETYVGGNTKAFVTDYIGVTKDGIYRYAIDGKEASKPILLLKLPPKAGDEWNMEAKVGTETITVAMKTTEQKLTVPAGSYDAVVVSGKIESGNQSVPVTNYFVKDVGLAKIKTEIGGQTIEIELAKFEPGK